MPEKSPALITEDEARDLLGTDAFAEAVEAGELRRVQHEGTAFVLGADVDKVKRSSDPRHLAAVLRGEEDEDEDNGPRALARDIPRL